MTQAFVASILTSADWNFLFHEEFQDMETGMFNYGFRYYHAQLGRWISRDPGGEVSGLNLYSFVGNDPSNYFDSLGFARWIKTGKSRNVPGTQREIGREHKKYTEKSWEMENGCCMYRVKDCEGDIIEYTVDTENEELNLTRHELENLASVAGAIAAVAGVIGGVAAIAFLYAPNPTTGSVAAIAGGAGGILGGLSGLINFIATESGDPTRWVPGSPSHLTSDTIKCVDVKGSPVAVDRSNCYPDV